MSDLTVEYSSCHYLLLCRVIKFSELFQFVCFYSMYSQLLFRSYLLKLQFNSIRLFLLRFLTALERLVHLPTVGPLCQSVVKTVYHPGPDEYLWLQTWDDHRHPWRSTEPDGHRHSWSGQESANHRHP